MSLSTLRRLFGGSDVGLPTASAELMALVARSMPQSDAETAALVGAVAGLMSTVAHADRVYTDEERFHVRTALERMHALSAGSAAAISELLETRMAELAHESLQTYTRILYEGMERGGRLEVLDVLMDLAAADDVLSTEETNLLRRIARALGLSDDEYLASQQRHRDKLGVLGAGK
jgi:uncharacterized tellurite resistance protein B-like protein